MAVSRFNPDYPDAGLVQVVPTSVTVGSGSGSANGNGTVDFSGVSSVSLNNIFSDIYTNYLIRIQYTGATASGNLTFKFRTSGTDNSNANYQRQEIYSSSTTVAGIRNTNQTSFTISSLQTDFSIADIYLYNPQIVSNTGAQVFVGITPATTGPVTSHLMGGFNATTQFDAMSFISTGANMTGSISIYGYRK